MKNFNLITYGEALAVYAILLAFVQYSSPIIKFRLHVIYRNWEKWLLWRCTTAVLGVFFCRFYCQFFESNYLFCRNCVVVIEIAACIIMPLIFIKMIWLTCKPVKLEKKNFERYLAECKKIISRGVETELRELGIEICESIPTFVKYAGEYDVTSFETRNRNAKELPISEESEICIQLLESFSDPNFCKLLVLHNPETVIRYIQEIQENEFHRPERNEDRWGIPFLQEIVKQSFNHEDSILYKNFDLSKQYKNLLFGYIIFVESRFDPLRSISLDIDSPSWQIDKFSEIALMCSKSYFLSENLYFFAKHILNINKLFYEANKLINILISDDIILKQRNTIELMWKLGNIWEKIFKTIMEENEEYIKNTKDQSSGEVWIQYIQNLTKGISIHDVVANAMFDLLVNLSWIKDNDNDIRSAFLGILKPWWKNQTTIASPFFIKLKENVWERLRFNFEENAYPPISRPLLNILGLNYPEAGTLSPFDEFHKEFLDYFKTNFEMAYKKIGDKVLNFLPNHMAYDEQEGKIFYKGNPDIFLSLRASHVN